jgi:hypothetical protein
MVRNVSEAILSGFKTSKITMTVGRSLLALLLVAGLLLTCVRSSQAVTLPTFEIGSVVPGVSVTIKCRNFPDGVRWNVYMGTHGTEGVGGIKVGEIPTHSVGFFDLTFSIPDALKNQAYIDIRTDGTDGYYAWNSFHNGGTSTSIVTPPVYSIIPTFSITSVVTDTSVTIQTYNFPPGQTFTVRMGPYGSYGIGGTVVGTVDSGAGGSFAATYNIPDGLKRSAQIAIRMDSPQGYYSFNWFDNKVVTPTTPAATPTTSPTYVPVPSTYYGYPYFYIASVVQNTSVTITGYNFPPGQTYTVTMGPYGSYGIGGIVVGTTSSGAGGALSATYTVPAALAGSYQIAIRLQSPEGYYAYNWFYNNTTTP